MDQWAALVPVSGMRRHAGRLIDDDEVVILEQHLERDFLRLGLGFPRHRPGDLDRLAGGGVLRRLGRFAVDENAAVAHEPLDAATRNVRQPGGEIAVEPLAWERLVDRHHRRLRAGLVSWNFPVHVNALGQVADNPHPDTSQRRK